MSKEMKLGIFVFCVFAVLMLVLEGVSKNHFIDRCMNNDLSKFECEMYWADINER